MRISHVLIPVGNGYLDGICVFDTIQVYIPCKNVSYLGEIALLSMWFRMVLTQILTQVYKDKSHLDMCTRYLCLAGITILI